MAPSGAGLVSVRGQKSGGVRFDHAIEHHFHGVRVDPLIVIFLSRTFDGVQIFFAKFVGVQSVGNVKTNGELLILSGVDRAAEGWQNLRQHYARG